MKEFLSQIKQSTVFFGIEQNGAPIFTGTGFLVQIDGVYYVVTAKHVVQQQHDKMSIFLNSKNFGINNKPIDNILADGLSWKSHPDASVDIAMLPFPLTPMIDKAKFIPNGLFFHDIGELQELIDVFFLSYQPGINNVQRDQSISPIIRKGTISRVNPDRTFYIDGSAFPGNSGSPVFSLPTPLKYSSSGNEIQLGGLREIKLVGIIGAYVQYKDVAVSQQTGETRVVFTENTGLALVYSTVLIDEIIKSIDFQEQHQKLSNVQKAQAVSSHEHTTAL